MKNVAVQYNTRAQTLTLALEDLRTRCRKSPGFLRLLKLAANEKLRGRRPQLAASNKVALRGLEMAVGAFERQMVLEVEEPYRDAYLERLGGAWEEVSRDTATRAAEATTLDTLRVMKVTVYRSDISREDAAKLDASSAPDELYFAEPDVEFAENREREWAHGEGKRQEIAAKKETWFDAYRPLPFKAEVEPKAEPKVVEIPEGRWYYSSQQKMPSDCRRILEEEQQSERIRKMELASDDAEIERQQRRFEFRYKKMLDYYQRVKPQRELAAQL